MRAIIRKTKNFIEQIRGAEEAVRRRWVIILSSVASVFVIFLWIGAMSIAIRAPEGPAGFVLREEAPSEERGGGFAAVLKAGVRALGEGVAEGARDILASISGIVGKKRTIEIVPGGR